MISEEMHVYVVLLKITRNNNNLKCVSKFFFFKSIPDNYNTRIVKIGNIH